MTTVADVMGWMDDAYPPRLAESWDRVGLACGDPAAEVDTILFAVDLTDEVVEQARSLGAQLVITHHPLLLRGVNAIRRDQPKGRLVMALIEAGIALFSAHTNADAAVDGVSDALAAALDLRDTRPLASVPSAGLDTIVTFCPPEHAPALVDALGAAGAGHIGAYDSCAFTSEGVGQFRPLDGADPFIGTRGELTRTPEVRIEMVLPRGRRRAVVDALLQAHPYETPAYSVLPLADVDSDAGLGRIGRLRTPVTASEVAKRLAAALPTTAGGVRLGGDPDRTITTVAVMGGAGDSFLDAVRGTDADLYVTSDLRHHPAQEFLQHDGAPALVDISHWAAEWMWLPRAEAMIRERAKTAGVAMTTAVSRINTDPWRVRF